MEEIAGVVLAGGLSQRMGGGDKALALIDGRPLVAHVLARLAAQAAPVAVNANGDPSRFSALNVPVIADEVPDFPGPLAGILAAMRWARAAAPGSRFVATAACDTPFLPLDLVARMRAAVTAYPQIVQAKSEGRVHPVFSLWPLVLAEELAVALAGGTRKVSAWAEAHPHVTVHFAKLRVGGLDVDPFFNANTPDELAQAERIARAIRLGGSDRQ